MTSSATQSPVQLLKLRKYHFVLSPSISSVFAVLLLYDGAEFWLCWKLGQELVHHGTVSWLLSAYKRGQVCREQDDDFKKHKAIGS